MIELREATVRAPDGAVLVHPVTATLTERRVAVVGANGSGKSTLLRLLNGLLLPTSGSVRVHGRDTATDGPAVRRDVGFVFTDPEAQILMPTPREDVALSLRGRVRRKADDAAALAVLEHFGLAAHADRSAHGLSAGQKQLLALASVLATGPRVLVCDEPTTLLDLRWRTHVDRLLTGLDAQVVTATHDLDAARRADRVLVVDDGHVVHDGAPDAGVDLYVARMTAGELR